MTKLHKKLYAFLIPLVVVAYFGIAILFAGKQTPMPGGTAYGVIQFAPVPECQRLAEDLVRVFPQRPLPDNQYQYIRFKLQACTKKHSHDVKRVDG